MTSPSFESFYLELQGSSPAPSFGKELERYWERPVSELCTLAEPAVLDDETRERHRLCAYALMTITWHYWCGKKKGGRGEYPLNSVRGPDDPDFLDGDYRGHNIAALAVDRDGNVLDFEFNHNELLRSSAEHAEARLVRRLYSLAQIREATPVTPGAPSRPPADPGRISLEDVTLYTTLESCSQCSGVMALAKVREVVYLQTDPGMYFIGRILRNLTPQNLRAPLPIGGGEIHLDEFAELDAAYEAFAVAVKETPFWVGPDGFKDHSSSITSFLCTDAARRIFAQGRERFVAYQQASDTTTSPANQRLAEALSTFVDYAVTLGARATPHNL